MGRKIDLTIEGLKRKRRKRKGDDPSQEIWPTFIEADQPFMRQFRFKFFRGDTYYDEEQEKWLPIQEWWDDWTEKGRDSVFLDLTTPNERQVDDFDYVYMGNGFVLTKDQIQAAYPDGASPDDRLPLQIETERDDDTKRFVKFANGINARIRLTTNDDSEKAQFAGSQDLLKEGTKKGAWRFTDKDSDEPDEFRLLGVLTPAPFGLAIDEIGMKCIAHYIEQANPGVSQLSYKIDWLEPEGPHIIPFNTADETNFKVTLEPDYDADAVSGKILKMKPLTDIEIYLMFRRWLYYRTNPLLWYKFKTIDTAIINVVGTGTGEDNGSDGCTNMEWDYDTAPLCESSCTSPLAYCYSGNPYGCSKIACSGNKEVAGVFADGCYPWFCCPYTISATWSFGGGGCTYSAVSSEPCPVDYRGCTTGEPPWFSCTGAESEWETCEMSLSYTYQVTKAAVLYGNSYIYAWWSPPPVDFFVKTAEPEAEGDTCCAQEVSSEWCFKAGTAPETPVSKHTFDVVGDESFDDAQQHCLDAELTDEEIAASITNQDLADRVIGGYNSVHWFAPGRWPWTQVQSPLDQAGTLNIYNKFGTLPDLKPISQTEIYSKQQYSGRTDMLADFWNEIQRQWLIQNAAEKMGTVAADFNDPEGGTRSYGETFLSNRTTRAVNYGIGLSPAQPGTLVAIIKIAGKNHYVWRKTEEDFTEREVLIDGNDFDKPFASFEGPAYSQAMTFLRHFSGTGRKATHILSEKSKACKTNVEYGLTDDRPVESGDCIYVKKQFLESGNGSVELESPVYTIVSRQRAYGWGETYYGTNLMKHEELGTYNQTMINEH